MTKKLKTKTSECCVADAVSAAYDEFQSLQEEIGTWADNMEEKLSHTAKYEEVSECRDALDNFAGDAPDVPECIAQVRISVVEVTSSKSRATRCDNAIAALQAVVEAAQKKLEIINEQIEAAKGDVSPEQVDGDEDDVSALEEFINALEETVGEAEGVSFPGMY